MKSNVVGFMAKGKTRRVVPAFNYVDPKGRCLRTTNKGYADAMNARVGPPRPDKGAA